MTTYIGVLPEFHRLSNDIVSEAMPDASLASFCKGTGDAHTSQAASLVAFGNYPFVRQNVLNTSNQDNGILSYSMLWVQSVLDYVIYSGDTALADSLASNIHSKLYKAVENIRTGVNPSFYGWDERLGTGFENPGCAEAFVEDTITIRVRINQVRGENASVAGLFVD